MASANCFPCSSARSPRRIGVASFANAQLVMRFGMRRLARIALLQRRMRARRRCFYSRRRIRTAIRRCALLMACMLVCFFCNGILFGNYNARALEPMGHIAGVAAAITGSLANAVAIALRHADRARLRRHRAAADRGLCHREHRGPDAHRKRGVAGARPAAPDRGGGPQEPRRPASALMSRFMPPPSALEMVPVN